MHGYKEVIDLALLKEITEYRKMIMKTLCSDEEVVRLITDKSDLSVPNRELMYSQIYPYAYTPDTTKEVSTYICFRITVPEVMNKTYKKMNVTFYIFTHQSLMRTQDGLRPDLIGEALERLFNGSLDLGLGRVQLEGMDDISPTTGYHGIAVEYAVMEYNRPSIHGDKGR